MPSLFEMLGQTWPAQLAKSAYGAVTLPGDVYAGKVDPLSDEGIGRAADLGGMVMGGTYAAAPAGAMGAGAVKPIRAYHGSPHDFDRFDLSKIGTGEGAQMYGHGLYFAENPAVAKEYRDVLTRRPVNDAGIDPAVAGGAVFDIAAKSGDLINGKIPFGPTRSLLTRDEIVSGFQQGKYSPFDLPPAMQRQIVDQIKPPGRMYEVNINAAPEHFLDWDAIVPKGAPIRGMIADDAMKRTGSAYADVRNAGKDAFLSATRPELTGEGAYRSLVRANLDAPRGEAVTRASSMLNEAGIPGIKYLDQGSRFNQALYNDNPIAKEALKFVEAAGGNSQKAGELFYNSSPVERWGTSERDEISRLIQQSGNQPTSNYVLFRDDIIDIVKKYGLAGAAAMYGISQDEAKAAMDNKPETKIGRQTYGDEE